MGLSLSLRIEEHVSHYEDTSPPTAAIEWTAVQRIDLEYAYTYWIRSFIARIHETAPDLHHPSQHGDDTGEIIYDNIDLGIRHLKDLPHFDFFEAIVPMLRYYESVNRAYRQSEDLYTKQYRMVVEYH